MPLDTLTATPFHAAGAAPTTAPTSLDQLTSKPFTPPSTPDAHAGGGGFEVKTIPAKLGGGAYNLDKSDPQRIINTGHTTYGGEPSVKGMERDDIVPVSLGGANENKANINMQPMRYATHKDTVEKYMANQVKQGKLSTDEARLKVYDWANQDVPGQPAYNKNFHADDFLSAPADSSTGFVRETLKGLVPSSPAADALHSVLSAKDNSTMGVIKNTILGIPEAAKNVGVDLLRSFPRTAVSVGESLTGEKERTPTGPIGKFLAGDLPIKDVQGTGEDTLKQFGASDPIAKKYGMPVGMALSALNLYPGTPEGAADEDAAKTLVEQVITSAAKEEAGSVAETGLIDAARAASKAIPPTHLIDTPERAEVRTAIANELYGQGAAKQGKRADIVLGLPASGKSTIAEKLADHHGSLVIDSDKAKAMTPEYGEGIGAQAVHQESDKIANTVLEHASGKGDNLALPMVGRDTTKVKGLVDNLKAKGYDVYLHHADVSPEVAKTRAISRFMQTGRFVDPEYIDSVGLTPKATHDTLHTYERLSGWSKLSTEGEAPKVLEHQNAGLPESIHGGTIPGEDVAGQPGNRAESIREINGAKENNAGASEGELPPSDGNGAENGSGIGQTGETLNAEPFKLPYTIRPGRGFDPKEVVITGGSDNGFLSDVAKTFGARYVNREGGLVLPIEKQGQFEAAVKAVEDGKIKPPPSVFGTAADRASWRKQFATVVKQDNQALIAKQPAPEVPPQQESETESQIQAPRTSERRWATNEGDLPKEKTQVRWSIPERPSTAHTGNTDEPIAYDPIIAQNNGNVLPPINKGGMQAPEIDWTKAHDIAAIRLSTDTMERNVEKIFGPQADKINQFLVEPTRTNETSRVKFVSDLRKEIKTNVVDNLGIRANSNESALVQRWGEGHMTEEMLQQETHGDTAAATKIKTAAAALRDKYDQLYEMWNEARAAHGMKPIGHIDNYFRHFPDFGSFMANFNPIGTSRQLPTAIAGITDFFRSSTPWSSAAMKRTGAITKLDAIGGLDNYLDTASRAIFHTDSVQRGRLLEKYVRQSAQALEQTAQFGPDGARLGIQLPNFASNLNDWTNLVSGKQARLDRAIESVVGRPALAMMRSVIRRFGLNVIGGNVSAAATHSIPTIYTLATTDTDAAFRGLMATLPKPFMGDFNTIGGQTSSFLTRRFGVRAIDPTLGEKVATGMSSPFRWVDEFISHFAVAGKFEEGIGHGLSAEEAMKQADNYAARVIGDRSTGNLPNLMNTKTLGMITQFQIEVNDNLKVLMHDIPRWEGGSPAKISYKLAKFAVYSYMFNVVMQNIKGSGKGLDPINMGLTLAGLNTEGEGKGTMDRLKAFGTELAGELPFASIVTQGQYPVLQAFPLAELAKGNYGAAGQKFASSFLSPVGGGVQALKSYKGIMAWRAGVVLDASGKTVTPIPQTLPNLLQGTMFGPNAWAGVKSSRAETQKLSALLQLQQATSKAKNQQASAIATDLTTMAANEGNDAAQAHLMQIADQDPDMAKRVLSALKNQGAGVTKEDTMVKTLGIKNGMRAQYIKQKLAAMSSNEEKQQYLLDLANKKILTAEVLQQVVAP